jgi:hypothetical protein
MIYPAALALCWLCVFGSAALYLAWLILTDKTELQRALERFEKVNHHDQF